MAEKRELLAFALRILQAELDRASVAHLPLPMDGYLPHRNGETGFTTLACWLQCTLSERIALVEIMCSHFEDDIGQADASEAAFHRALIIGNRLAVHHNSFAAFHSVIRCGADRLVNDAAAKSKFGKYLHDVIYDLSANLVTHPLKPWLKAWTLVLSAIMSERSEGYTQTNGSCCRQGP